MDEMRMDERLRAYGDLEGLDPESRDAAVVRRLQTRAPRHPQPRNLLPGKPDPECTACAGDAAVCPLGGVNWRLCPHTSATSPPITAPWPHSR